jgi:DNA-binding NarL/FixJ family response regulator
MNHLVNSQDYPHTLPNLETKNGNLLNTQNVGMLFTSRQLEILGLITKGFTNKEIANAFYIEEKTVKRHRQNIMNKVGISGRQEMRIFLRNIQVILQDGTKSTTNSENK